MTLEGSMKKKSDSTGELNTLRKREAELTRLNQELQKEITERNKEEAKIRRLATVVRDSNDAITIQDFEGRITTWNHGAELMYGYSEEEALKMSIGHLTPPDKVAEQNEFTRRLKAGEPITSFETKRVTKDGRILDVWLTVTKVMDDTGKPIGIASTERDITERKKAEEKYRNTLDNMKEGYQVIGHDWRYIYVNDAVAEHGRKKKQELIGHTMMEAYPGIENTEMFATLKICMEKRTQHHLENKFTYPNGSEEWFDLSIEPVPEGISIFSLDITERKRAEEVLRQGGAYNRSLIEASLDPLVTIGPDGRITDVNRATEQVTGRLRQQLVGTDFLDYFTEPEKARAGYQQVFKDGEVRDYPLEIRRLDGHVIPVLYNASVYRDEKGKVVGVFAAARDITERKQAEEALKISQERLLFATEGANLGIWNWDTVTGELIWSNKCKALFGIPLDETMSYPRFSTALHPDDRERTDKAVKDALDNHKDYDIEYRSLWPDGSIHWLAAKGRGYYDATGKAVRLEGVVLDISERKRAEQELKKTLADLERSNKELEQFAYVASHDLQEPLRMVSSYTQLLARRYKDKLDQDANEFIDFAVDGANRMQRLINDLLMYSRVSTRGQPPEPVDTFSALGQAIANLGMAIDDNHAMISNDELPVVMADESQIVQVFQNLIANGIKFHGTEAPRIHISAAEKGNEWVFSVRDNGIGIAPEYHSRLFVIFQRLHGHDQYPGTGIGLAVCKRIVERHGGRIWVESEADKGSTFYFTLPKQGGRKL
jgi:PAS domain S-box-containing protein